MIIVDLDRVTMSRPERPLFTDVSLTIASGERIGVVGINGTGKSTLLRVAVGAITPESGQVRRGSGVRIAVLEQDPVLSAGTVLASVGEGWQAEAALSRLGMGDHFASSVDVLSGGQRKRVALAAALVEPADLLVLDEPTNHLDFDAIAWLTEQLVTTTAALLLVTHDRHVLDAVTTRVLELDRGRGYVHQGGYTGYLEGRDTREAQLARSEDSRRNLARSELAWLRRGAPARTRKPKARIAAAEATIARRADDPPARAAALDLHIGATPRLGNTIVELAGVSAGWGDGPDVIAGVDLALAPDERLGVMGLNGAGKSTLLEVLAGRVAPRAGSVVVGSTVAVGYWDQLGRALDPNARAIEVVAGPHRRPDWSDEAFLERFWFDADRAWSPVALLSGGERRRLQLVATLAARPNVLLLDEPTNDLDLDTLRALEDYLEHWPGALVVVSHDRAFLERTVTDVVVVDGGTVARRAGGFAGWAAARLQARGSTALASKGSGPKGSGPKVSGPKGADSSKGPASKGAASAVGGSKRSASTLRHLLKEAERTLGQLERRRQGAEEQLSAAVQAGEVTELARAGTALADVNAELAAAEEAWLALAEEAES